MVSGRKARALSWVQPIKMMPALEPVTPTVSRSARPESGACWRRGGGCRKDKDLYGWVCAVCADELDLYYRFWLGLRGGTVAQLFAEDVAADQVPSRPGSMGPGAPSGLSLTTACQRSRTVSAGVGVGRRTGVLFQGL